MGADSTLVNAAFRLGQTNGVLDMSNMFKANTGISAGFTKMARDAMGKYEAEKERSKVTKENRLKPFDKIVNDTITNIHEQGEPMPQPFVDLLISASEELRDDWEAAHTYSKGDAAVTAREKARIMGELKRYTNKIKNYREGAEAFAIERINNLNKGQVDENKIESHMMAIDFQNFTQNHKDGNVKLDWDKEGNIVTTVKNYSKRTKKVPFTNPSEQFLDAGSDNMTNEEESWSEFGDVNVTMASLNAAFPPTNKGHHAEFLGVMTQTSDIGSTDGSRKGAIKNYPKNKKIQIFKGKLSTKAQFQNVVDSTIEGSGFVDFSTAFLKDINIPFAVMDSMFYDDQTGDRVEVGSLFKTQLNLDKTPDAEGNQVINEKDRVLAEELSPKALEAFNKNVAALVDVYTNVHNPAFNLDRSSLAVAGYFAGLDEQNYNEEFDAAKADAFPREKTDTLDDERNLQAYELKSIAIQTKFKAAEKEGFTYENLQGLPINKKMHFVKQDGKVYLAYKTSQGKNITKVYEDPIDLKNKKQVLNILYQNSDIRPNEQNIKVTGETERVNYVNSPEYLNKFIINK